MNLVYYIFLLLIIFLLLSLLRKNEKLSPKKIKIYMYIVIILYLLRYIGLFLLCIVRSGVYIYSFKSFLYLNHVSIPLIALALDYVFLRWDKLRFTFNYFIALFIGCLYVVGMFFIKGKVIFDVNYGYIINIKNEIMLYLSSLIILGFLLLFSIYFIDKPNNNKRGMIYVIIGLIVVILENIIYIGGLRLFPYPIIGDAIFLILMNLGVNTFQTLKIKS